MAPLLLGLCVCVQVSPPFEIAEFDITFGEGINALGCVFDVAKDLEVLESRVSQKPQCSSATTKVPGVSTYLSMPPLCPVGLLKGPPHTATHAHGISSNSHVAKTRHKQGVDPTGCRYAACLTPACLLPLPLCVLRVPCVSQGSHYYFEGVKLAQGRDNVLLHLKDNPDTAARISTAVKQKMQERQAARVKPSNKADDSSGFGEDDFADDLLDDEALLQELENQAGRLEEP